MKKTALILNEESYKIIGACMTVHSELGSGLLEAIYQEALEEEFKIINLSYTREAPLEVFYKNKPLNKKYQADFICQNKIIVGLLVNFGKNKLEYKRFVNTK